MATESTKGGMGRAWLFTLTNIGFMMVIWMIDACLAALLPEIAEIYEGVTVVQGAQLVTTYNIGFMLASFIFGPLGDVLSRYKLIVMAGILFLVVGIVFALIRNFPAALLLRFGGGFFGGMLTVNLWSGLIHEVPKKHFNMALGLMAGTRAYSFVLGLPLVMNLVDWIGWTSTFLLLGFSITVPLLMFVFSSKRPGPLQKGGSLNPLLHFRETIRLPGIAWSLFGFLCARTAGSAPFVFTSLWLFQVYGFETSQRALLISVFGIGEIIGSWASVPIISKLGPPKTFYFGISGTIIFITILVFFKLPIWLIGSTLLLLSLSDRCFGMSFWRVYMPQDRKRSGTLSSMGNIVFAGSIAVATGIGAPIVDTFGWEPAAVLALILLIVGSQVLRFSLFVPERLAKAEDGW